MLLRLTVFGSSALLNWIVMVRPLTDVLRIVGAVVSASVKEIGPDPTRLFPSSETTWAPESGPGPRTYTCRWR